MEVTYDALKKRVAELEAENAGLSANQCLHNIHGDEAGNPYCPRIAELEKRVGDYYEGLEEGIKIGMEKAAKIAHEIAERGHITFNIAAGIRAKIVEPSIMSSMSTKPMENMK